MKWGVLEKAPYKKHEGILHGEEYVCPNCKGDGEYRGPHPYWKKCVRCSGLGTIVLAHYEGDEVK